MARNDSAYFLRGFFVGSVSTTCVFLSLSAFETEVNLPVFASRPIFRGMATSFDQSGSERRAAGTAGVASRMAGFASAAPFPRVGAAVVDCAALGILHDFLILGFHERPPYVEMRSGRNRRRDARHNASCDALCAALGNHSARAETEPGAGTVARLNPTSSSVTATSIATATLANPNPTNPSCHRSAEWPADASGVIAAVPKIAARVVEVQFAYVPYSAVQ